MIKYLRNKMGPNNCDDKTLVTRTLFSDKGISVGAAMVLGAVITGFFGLLTGVLALGGGLPWLLPAALIGTALTAAGIGLPVTGFFNSLHIDLDEECKRRHICPPGSESQRHQYIPYIPAPAPAVVAPVLADVFDPAAAVVLPESIRTMPAIKLARKGLSA